MDISNITVNTQSSILIDVGKKIYIDPLDIADATHDADYVFITHDHYDHYSMPDIHKILDEKTIFIIPAPLEMNLRRSTPVGSQICVVPGKVYETPDFKFETIAAYNKLKPFHPRRAGWCGYIIIIDGRRIYIAGDTDDIKEAEAVKCDIALVPIGGTYTMNYKEAARLINKIKPKVAIPTHYGSIVGNISDGEEFRKLVDDDIKVELKLHNQ
ncbi:MAG: MBL fold metallo-hydrolase [Lachnospiraceae bacterium]|nr:MBL fold metallo-hydrolase [Lachnospiraceae bacterium]